uniref:E3 ubiquitin-protein ligase RFWD3 n=1 Tax=Drosophila rhopaloa TaxID=1041015 RepID=A0A6P4EI33_DRORH
RDTLHLHFFCVYNGEYDKKKLVRELLAERKLSAQTDKQLTELLKDNQNVDINKLWEESDALLSQWQLEANKNEELRKRIVEQDLSKQTIINNEMLKLNKKLDEISEENSCCICFDHWEAGGDHCLVSLKCGHLFGKKCIRTYLQMADHCPNCREFASATDLRNVSQTTLQARKLPNTADN